MAFNPNDIRVSQSTSNGTELNLKPIKKDFADGDLDFKDQWRSLEDKRAEAQSARHSRSQQRNASQKNEHNARLDRAQDAQKLESTRETKRGEAGSVSSQSKVNSKLPNERIVEPRRESAGANEQSTSNKTDGAIAERVEQKHELEPAKNGETNSPGPIGAADVDVESSDLGISIEEGFVIQPEISLTEPTAELVAETPINSVVESTDVAEVLIAGGQLSSTAEDLVVHAKNEGLGVQVSAEEEPAIQLNGEAAAKLDNSLTAQNPAQSLSTAEKIAVQIKSELPSRAQLQNGISADMKIVEDELAEFELDPELKMAELLKSKTNKGDSKVPANLQLVKSVDANKPLAELSMERVVGKLDTAMLNNAYSEGASVSSDTARGAVTGFNHNFQLARDAAVQGRSAMQSTPGQAQWNAEVAEKVAWFSARNISAAEIRLDPPELGSLQIKIQLNSDQAQVTINSPHASVREALDQTSARLREMFDQQGLDLVDVNVGSGGDGSRSQAEGGGNGGSSFSGEADDEAPQTNVVQRKLSLVDSYA